MTENVNPRNVFMRVTDVEYINDFTMKLEFNHGEWRSVDFEPLMRGHHFFEELLVHENFIQFYLTPQTLEWYNGVDFAPEYLYEHGIPTTKPCRFDDDTPLPTAAEHTIAYGK